MNESEKFVWAGIGALVFRLLEAGIRFVFKQITENRLDRIVLNADLSHSTNVDSMERLGCPAMVVTVACKGKRTAKVAGVKLSGPLTREDLAAFEVGFQFPFGQSNNVKLPSPRLSVTLLQTTEPSNEHGFVLERDDVARFELPLAIPALPVFLSAPSEEVKLTATLFDGTDQVIKQGLVIQDFLRESLAAFKNMPMKLKQHVEMGVTVSAEELPDATEMIGRVNDEAIDIGEKDRPAEPRVEEEFTKVQMGKCHSVFQRIWNAWSESKSLSYIVIPDREIDTTAPHKSIEARFRIGVSEPETDVGLVELLVIFSILRDRIAAVREIDVKGADAVKVRSVVTTSYSDLEAAQLLAQIQMKPSHTAEPTTKTSDIGEDGA